jgi:hypothetical protein
MNDQPYSTCSQASADSALDSKAQGSELLPSAKSIPKPAACSNTGGRTFPTSGIFAESPEKFSERLGLLMELQEEFLASLRLRSDKCAVLKTSVGCGPKQSDWLAKLDPSLEFLRTRQVSLFSMGDENSTEFYQGFPRSGMICGGMLFPLQQSVQDISENVCSSSLPTPTAADGERGGRGDLLAIVKGRPNKHCDWMLPTPRASANEERQTKLTPSQEAGTHGLSLNATVHSRLLPTMRAGKHTSEDPESWQKRHEAGKVSTPPLEMVVRSALLPTATARGWKDTPGMARETEDGRKRDDQLPRRIFGDASVPKGGGMKMSLEFRCWFMGFPIDWLKPLADAPEMQSSHRSRK